MRSRTCVLMIVAAAVTTSGCGVTGDRGDRVRVTATVHGCDGRPPARAYARRILHDEGAGVLAEGTGGLVFDLKAPAFHWILVGAVNHGSLEIPLLLERGRSLRFDVRLEMPDVPRAPARDRLPACTGDFEVRFADETGRTARLAQAYLGVRRRERAYFTALHAHEEAGGATEEFSGEMLPVAAELAALAAVETDDVIRHTLELQSAGWLPNGLLDAERAVRVLETVPADAPGWSLSMDVFRPVARRHPDRRVVEEYARRVIETHADERVRSGVLMYLTQAAFADGRRTEAEGLYLRLLTEFPASPEAMDARAMWGPDRSIQAGRRVPGFAFQALDRPGERITDRSLAGRRYLIDFWSTSCGPCLAHLPTLRTLQARHGGTGFTILSVSVDPEAEVVFRFRRKRPMPWMHAILSGGLTDPAARSFGVDGVPTYVLVGADGTITAEPWEMLGDGLERTVDRVLGRRW